MGRQGWLGRLPEPPALELPVGGQMQAWPQQTPQVRFCGLPRSPLEQPGVRKWRDSGAPPFGRWVAPPVLLFPQARLR